MNIEERIANHARAAAVNTGRLRGTYRVLPWDFMVMAERLGAKVAYDPPEPIDLSECSMLMRVGPITAKVIADKKVGFDGWRCDEDGPRCDEGPAAP